MAAELQTNWRALAAQQFAGFRIIGNGPFAVLYAAANTLSVELFEHEIMARATGRNVQQLKPPAPRAVFRRNKMLDDD